ncbi:MAG: cytochrome P450 [Acidimicrobiia bacterium]
MALTATDARSSTADDLLDHLLATADGQADPYPAYRELRRIAPLHRCRFDGHWYATGFETTRALLSDPAFGKGPTLAPSRHGMDETRAESSRRRTRPSMITTDPPAHTRLRGAGKAAFTPPRVEALRARVRALVEERLDLLAEGGGGDLMAEVALALPITVIGELVGVPAPDRERFRPLLFEIMSADRPNQPPDAAAKAEAAFTEFREYFEAVVAERRAERAAGRTSPDLLGALVESAADGTLDDDELQGTVSLIYIAGFLTTANLIGNGLVALFDHPSARAQVWSDTGLVEDAVEEMLRYDTPVQMIHRIARRDVEVGDARIRGGETVFTLLGAANRDPARFPDPDRFDVSRRDNAHLAFAWGLHFCLGARLARLEANLVFEGLIRRFAAVEPDGEPKRSPGLFIRGFSELPVRVANR